MSYIHIRKNNMELRDHLDQILDIYNYFNGAVLTDKDGIVEYYYNNRPDMNGLKEKDVIGKNILDVYPNITKETSSIMNVIESGEPIVNQLQSMASYKGKIINAFNTTLPVKNEGTVIGVIEISKYVDDDYESNIELRKEKNEEKKYSLYKISDMVSASKSMKSLKDKIYRVSKTDSSVLIYGETGTGKEMVAQSIHTLGPRRSKKFFSQNCSAIPASLLESILFGTVKGSFTGAENKIGIFEAVDGGTLFLDEINSMDSTMQAKILKVLEDKQIIRVGGVDPIPIDVRIIAASNEDPMKSVEKGEFRKDLYYRLKVVQLNIPPLRERKEDISMLSEYFIKSYNEQMGYSIKGLDDEVKNFFSDHDWAGNVRELKNAVESAFNICSGDMITIDDIRDFFGQGDDDTNPVDMRTLKDKVKAFEKGEIEKAISVSKSLSEAARNLGISRQGLNNKLNEYNIKL